MSKLLQLYQDYQEFDAQLEKTLETKEKMREQIVKEMQKAGVDKDQTPFGTFSVTEKTTYAFTKEFDETTKELKDKLKKKLKIMADSEIEAGRTTPTTENGLHYSRTKE